MAHRVTARPVAKTRAATTAARPVTTSHASEPAVQNPRGGPAPKIIHKESKADRFPTPEQLDQLPAVLGEKPALLTRNAA
jgi:hypothetical protein